MFRQSRGTVELGILFQAVILIFLWILAMESAQKKKEEEEVSLKKIINESKNGLVYVKEDLIDSEFCFLVFFFICESE